AGFCQAHKIARRTFHAGVVHCSNVARCAPVKHFFFAAGLVGLVVAWSPLTVHAASLDVRPSARSGMTVHPQRCACHKAVRRHGSRAHAQTTYADWTYFDPCCRATGHPRPKGFCGGGRLFLGRGRGGTAGTARVFWPQPPFFWTKTGGVPSP